MSAKTKKPSTSDRVATAAKQAGLVLMTAATTLGMLELPSHPEKRVVLPARASFAFAENSLDLEGNNPLRREREEPAPHYISYSVVERTPARSGH